MGWRNRGWHIAIFMTLVACSPSLNWRQVPVEKLSALLPCKPDTAVRQVNLLGVAQPLKMWGCEAGGALFAVSHMPVPAGTQADVLMSAWQTAAVQNVRATGNDALPFKPPLRADGAIGSSNMIRLVGQRADGKEVKAQLAWFTAAGVVYHLAVYGSVLSPAMLEPFFTEIRWL